MAEIADISKTDELSRLLDHAAVASGQLVNLTSLGSSLSVDSKTVDRWLTLLEQMFVLRRVRACHRNDLKRLQAAAGSSFSCGILLHAGDRIQRAGDQLFAMPVSQLWMARM